MYLRYLKDIKKNTPKAVIIYSNNQEKRLLPSVPVGPESNHGISQM